MARSVLLSLAALVPVLGQLRPRDALVTWYEAGDCSVSAVDHRTLVIAVSGYAQRVPNGVSYPSYKIECARTASVGLPQGIISYCLDNEGLDCPIRTPFRNDQCLSFNDRSLFGSASVSVTCPTSEEEVLVPGVGSSLNSTDVELNWFGTPGCGIPTGPNFDRTIVVLTAGLCHRVPDAPSTGSGYRALCSGDGKGVLQFCSAADCSNCELAAPFNDKECIASDAVRYGSASYSVLCPPNPVNVLQ